MISCSFNNVAKWVSWQLGGDGRVDQLHINTKKAKKIVMKSLRKSLSEVLPLSLEEHIVENILGHLNILDEESWKLKTAEEDKPRLSSLYHQLRQVYTKIRNELLLLGLNYNYLTPEVVDQLQEILAEIKREDGIDEEI